MAIAVDSNPPPAPLPDALLALLDELGLAVPYDLGRWRITAAELEPSTAAELEHGTVVLRLESDGDAFEARLRPADPHARAFDRTPSFNVSHGMETLSPAALGALRALVALLKRLDNGGLKIPSPTRGSSSVASLDPAPSIGGYATASAEEPPDPPERHVDAAQGIFEFHRVRVDALGPFHDALFDIYSGRLGGLIVQGVYTPEEMERVAARLEGRAVSFDETKFPPQFKSSFLGRCLDGSDPQLTEYLPAAARFREGTRTLFDGLAEFEERMADVLGRISGGRPVSVPRFPDGRAYSPATIRVLPPGGQIGSHCGNEASTRVAYTHLNTILDLGDQVSFFLVLQAPEAGGELVVYSLRWDQIDEGHIVDGRTNVNALLAESRWSAYAPQAGDLLVFDGGRYFHRVSVVKGKRTRWTIGGFAMFSKNHGEIFHWG